MIIGQVHTGITVTNLEKSIAFYRDILGLTLTKVEPERSTRGEKLGVPGAVIQLAVLEYAEGCSVELIEYKTPPSPGEYAPPINMPGSVHIAFKVDDIAAQIKKMEAHGVSFIGGPEPCVIDEGPIAGWKWIYFKDPDGTNLEFIEGDLAP